MNELGRNNLFFKKRKRNRKNKWLLVVLFDRDDLEVFIIIIFIQ